MISLALLSSLILASTASARPAWKRGTGEIQCPVVLSGFVPADATQTPAEVEGTLKVVAAGDTAITAEAPTGVEPMVEAPTTVTVSPAAAGTVTATVDGRKITANVDPATGTATLPLVFPREGEYSVPVEFTPADPRAALRFELFVAGVELANAFDELTDAAEQRERFGRDVAERRRLYGAEEGEDWGVDEDFLRALEHGMPAGSGIALGFDRLAMLASGARRIEDVLWLPFPGG